MVLGTHVELWMKEIDYLGKFALDENDQIWPKITQKLGFGDLGLRKLVCWF